MSGAHTDDEPGEPDDYDENNHLSLWGVILPTIEEMVNNGPVRQEDVEFGICTLQSLVSQFKARSEAPVSESEQEGANQRAPPPSADPGTKGGGKGKGKGATKGGAPVRPVGAKPDT